MIVYSRDEFSFQEDSYILRLNSIIPKELFSQHKREKLTIFLPLVSGGRGPPHTVQNKTLLGERNSGNAHGRPD